MKRLLTDLAGLSVRYGRPLLIWDGDCEYCRQWIECCHPLVLKRVDQAQYQQIAAQHPHIPAEDFGRAVQLVLGDGRVFSGAQAIFQVLAYVPWMGWLFWMYKWTPGFALLSEALYRVIASRRALLSRLVTRSEPDNLYYGRSCSVHTIDLSRNP